MKISSLMVNGSEYEIQDLELTGRVDELESKQPAVYTAGQTYVKGQLVSHNNVLYMVKVNSTNTEPSSDNSDYNTMSMHVTQELGYSEYLPVSQKTTTDKFNKILGVDILFERGLIYIDNGTNQASNISIRTVDYIDLQTIDSIVSNKNYVVLYYTEDKQYLGYTQQKFKNDAYDNIKYIRIILIGGDTVLDYEHPEQYITIYTNSLKDDIKNLYNIVTNIDHYYPSKNIDITNYGYYNTFAKSIGLSCSMEYTHNTDWKCVYINVSKNDMFIINGHAGITAKLWAFVDVENDNKILNAANGNAVEHNLIIKAPCDCVLVCNFRIYPLTVEPMICKAIKGVQQSDVNNDTHVKKLPDTPLEIISQTPNFASVIHSWGFVGDSQMSGFTDVAGVSNYEYSWGQRMCKLLGTEGYNFSYGGQTAKGWIESTQKPERCWHGAQTNFKQAYIIGLGLNDRAEIVKGNLLLGSVENDIAEDYEDNNGTFAGYYAGIIQRIRSIRPDSPIFIVTVPRYSQTVDFSGINQVIKDCSNVFDNVWLIDLDKYCVMRNSVFNDAYMGSAHMTFIGFQYAAFQMSTYIDWIIQNNIDAFKNIGLITYNHEN